MKLLNLPLLKATSFFVIGILLAYYTSIPMALSLWVFAFALLALCFSFILLKNKFKNSLSFTCLSALCFMCLGIFKLQQHDQKQRPSHYTNALAVSKDSIIPITFQVREVLKPNNYYSKYSIKILKINDKSVTGQSLLLVRKDSLVQPLDVDDLRISFAPLQDINSSLNPGQFNYKSYLERRYIYHQLLDRDDLLIQIPKKDKTLRGYAHQFRKLIQTQLKAKTFTADELAIINALLLGQRQEMSTELNANYTNAGAVHMLAVSGLHVGIILLILDTMFAPLTYVKHGRLFKTFSILILLWCFAIIAGLSPSVTRAVTMFSIVAIGMNLKRPTNIYNTLVSSIFVLVLFDPLIIFEIGFQMSYLAVLGIVTIQPMIVKLWKPRWKPVKLLWQIFTVTLAAQCGVVPISLYYFHQFPGLFWLSNLVILPFLGILLGTGLLVILLALLNILPLWFSELYAFLLSSMNSFIAWVAQQDQYVFKNIAFGSLQLLFVYISIVTFIALFKKPNFQRMSIALSSVLLLQTTFIYEKIKAQNSLPVLIVFHKSKSTIVGQKIGTELFIDHNLNTEELQTNNIITTFIMEQNVLRTMEDPIKNCYAFAGKSLLVVDSIGLYDPKVFLPNETLLIQSPKVNLERLIDSLQPQRIIADGSNYKSYVARWKATCIKKNIPFHHTGEKGAYFFYP